MFRELCHGRNPQRPRMRPAATESEQSPSGASLARSPQSARKTLVNTARPHAGNPALAGSRGHFYEPTFRPMAMTCRHYPVSGNGVSRGLSSLGPMIWPARNGSKGRGATRSYNSSVNSQMAYSRIALQTEDLDARKADYRVNLGGTFGGPPQTLLRGHFRDSRLRFLGSGRELPWAPAIHFPGPTTTSSATYSTSAILPDPSNCRYTNAPSPPLA